MTNGTASEKRDFDAATTSSSGRWRRGGLVVLLLMGIAGGAFVARGGLSEQQPDGNKPTRTKKAQTKTGRIPRNPFPRRFKAPSLDGGTAWLNTSGPITVKDLRGKIVVLDFWTYCCINCMHILPDLKALEKKYARQIVVIGVHSAKFDNEKDSNNIRKAILRYGIEHPVINDSKMTVWRKFEVRAWPTLAVIDPEGFYCGFVNGEGNRPLLELVIKKLIAHHRAKGTLDETPIRFDLERFKQKPTPLRFPGKVLVDEPHDRLFIADSSHNRIIVSSLDGKLKDVIGTGEIGNKSGKFHEARFDHPQGMALVGDTLFVADTENHLIRRIHLKTKLVSTLAGTGKQARRRYASGNLRTVPLNSPWAIAHVKGTLYICMAGPHQIWSHKLGSSTVQVFAGDGREDIGNGPLLAAKFAQPSGITTDGKHLWVADSEGSAIRQIDLDRRGRVMTVAGTSDLPLGRSLFAFGDRDGFGNRARFQHAMGVAWYNGQLFVADAFNHKIRKVVLLKNGGKVTTFLGDGTPGTRLKPARLWEPAGVAVAPKSGKLYIADTNNHRICVADLKTGDMQELKIAGLKPPKPPSDSPFASTSADDAINLKQQTVQSGKPVAVTFAVKLPNGFKLNPDFPHRFQLATKDEQQLFAKSALRLKATVGSDGKSLTVALPLGKSAGKATFNAALTFGFCRAGKGGLCKLKTVHWKLPLKAAADSGSSKLTINVDATRS